MRPQPTKGGPTWNGYPKERLGNDTFNQYNSFTNYNIPAISNIDPMNQFQQSFYSLGWPPPVEGEFPPEENRFPIEEDVFPTEEDMFPIEEDVFPTEEDMFPIEQDVFPTEEDEFLADMDWVPTKDDVFPPQENWFLPRTPLFAEATMFVGETNKNENKKEDRGDASALTCSYCHSRWSDRKSLSRHLRIHGFEPEPFTCEQCPYSTIRAVSFQRHKRTCKKRSDIRSALASIGKSEKSWACTDYRFRGSNPIKNNRCDQGFSWHRRAQHEERDHNHFYCGKCFRLFSCREEKQRHYETSVHCTGCQVCFTANDVLGQQEYHSVDDWLHKHTCLDAKLRPLFYEEKWQKIYALYYADGLIHNPYFSENQNEARLDLVENSTDRNSELPQELTVFMEQNEKEKQTIHSVTSLTDRHADEMKSSHLLDNPVDDINMTALNQTQSRMMQPHLLTQLAAHTDSGYASTVHGNFTKKSDDLITRSDPAIGVVALDVKDDAEFKKTRGSHIVNERNLKFVEEEDARTIYSEALSLLGSASGGYITEFANDLYNKVHSDEANQETKQKVIDILPDLLRNFALKLGHEKQDKKYLEVMFFIHKFRKYVFVILLLKTPPSALR
jgi:hypothetical protein